MEFTEIYEDLDLGHSSKVREQHALRHQVETNVLREILSDLDINLMIDISYKAKITGNRLESVYKRLAVLILNYSNFIDASKVRDSCIFQDFRELPEEIHSLGFFYSQKLTRITVNGGYGKMVPVANQKLIRAILQKKENKFANYPFRDEYWLIMVEKFLLEMDHYNEVQEVEFITSFDRVFILRQGEVIELKAAKPIRTRTCD